MRTVAVLPCAGRDGAAEGRRDGGNVRVELGNSGGAEVEAQNADVAALDRGVLNPVVKRLEILEGKRPSSNCGAPDHELLQNTMS